MPSTGAYLGLGDDDDKQMFSKHLLDSDTHGKSLLKPINLFLEHLSIKSTVAFLNQFRVSNYSHEYLHRKIS